MTQQSRFRSIVAALVTVAVISITVPVAQAATKKKPSSAKQEFYRCRDANGQVQFGQSIPPACMNLDIEVVDASGRLIRTIDGERSLATRAQKDAAETARTDAAQASAQRDRTLIATYLTVADIERLRDQRLGQLQAQAEVTSQYIVNLKERETRMMDSVSRYRPYSRSAKAPPLPDHVAEELVNTVNGLQVYQQELVKNMSEQTRLRDEFSSDIARFKQLKGIK